MYIYTFKNTLKEKRRSYLQDEGSYPKPLDCNVCKMRLSLLKINC